MRIITITYKRVKNLGNFQSEALEATADISDESNEDVAYATLRGWVLAQLDVPDARGLIAHSEETKRLF